MALPKYLQGPHRKLTAIEERCLDLKEQYEDRYGEWDWDEFGYVQTDEEMIEALEICLKEGKCMKEVRPEWCEELPPWIWT